MDHMERDTLDDKSNIVDVIDLCSDDDENESSSGDGQLNHDIENVSQTAITPASKLTSPSIESVQTTFEMYTETSQATMSMFNPDDSYPYQNQENHQSFLNGAQGSIVTEIDRLNKLKDISMQTISTANQAHISIDLTL